MKPQIIGPIVLIIVLYFLFFYLRPINNNMTVEQCRNQGGQSFRGDCVKDGGLINLQYKF